MKYVNNMSQDDGVLLHNILSDCVTDQALICPYADERDVILGDIAFTCGLIRIPFMEGDAVSAEREIVNKHGKHVWARDVLLKQNSYMTFYYREYIINPDKTVTPTNDGHYGDWVNVNVLVRNIKRGMEVINKARRIAAEQEEHKAKETVDNSNIVKVGRINDIKDAGAAHIVEF